MVRRARQAGFTYLALVILLAIIALVGAALLRIDALEQRARAEQDLLEIGAAFSAALDSYAAATPPGALPHPPTLQELLRDPRSPTPRRHLRRIFVDPITGKTEWGIVHLGDADQGIVAIHSLSDAAPLKVANFEPRFASFEGKTRLSQWLFSATRVQVAPAQPAPSAQPAPAPEPEPGPGPEPAPTPAAQDSVGAPPEVARPESEQAEDDEIGQRSQRDDAEQGDGAQ